MAGLRVPPADLGLVPLRPLTGGHVNTVWLCNSSSGLKVAKTTRHSNAALVWLDPVQAAARKAGLLSPSLLRWPDGALSRGGWTVEPFVEGNSTTVADSPALATRLRQFHLSTLFLPQRPGCCALPDLADPHHPVSRQVSSGLPAQVLDDLRPAFRDCSGLPQAAIHGDVGPGNLLSCAEGIVLIDWDEARRDCVFLDCVHIGAQEKLQARAHLAAEIILGWDREPDHARRLYDRFRAGLPDPQQDRLPDRADGPTSS